MKMGRLCRLLVLLFVVHATYEVVENGVIVDVIRKPWDESGDLRYATEARCLAAARAAVAHAPDILRRSELAPVGTAVVVLPRPTIGSEFVFPSGNRMRVVFSCREESR